MLTNIFDFVLPPASIALRPAEPRDAARLLVVHEDGRLEHRIFSDLPGFLREKDVLAVNDSRVIPARLKGRRPARERGGAGAGIEVTLHRPGAGGRYSAFAQPAKRLRPGDRVEFGDLNAVVLSRDGGAVELLFDREGPELAQAIARVGAPPLPPYIASRRAPDMRDRTDYQTVYAKEEGSVAAPTAGLHFTQGLLDRLARGGIARADLTLHVGAGTFLPVTAEDTHAHVMHAETIEVSAKAAAQLNASREAGGRVVAVGTTSLRTLESVADEAGRVRPFTGETDIFITPGYRFRAVDILLTNFHLPRSTLFMLVCAFSGTDTMKRAYAEAIREAYRFYSYGDACLLIRPA